MVVSKDGCKDVAKTLGQKSPLLVRGDFSNSIDKCVADTVRALIGCRTTFYNEAARGDIYFTQSVVRARVSEAPVDLLGRERRATA